MKRQKYHMELHDHLSANNAESSAKKGIIEKGRDLMRDILHGQLPLVSNKQVHNTLRRVVYRPEPRELFLSALTVSNTFRKCSLTDVSWLDTVLYQSGGDVGSLYALWACRAYSNIFLRFCDSCYSTNSIFSRGYGRQLNTRSLSKKSKTSMI